MDAGGFSKAVSNAAARSKATHCTNDARLQKFSGLQSKPVSQTVPISVFLALLVSFWRLRLETEPQGCVIKNAE